MWNRIDKTLSASDIQDIAAAAQTIHDKITSGKALTATEKRKGGWYLSPKALLLLKHALSLAKNNPASYPSLDVAAFERDIKLIEQLQIVENQILHLQYLVKDNRRLLTKDAAEQGFYVYSILKVMHDLGIVDGVGYQQLKPYMPRSGKNLKPKTEE